MRFPIASALIVLALTTPIHAQSAEDGVFPFPFERFELDNGLRAYLIQAGAPDQLIFVTMVRTGSRDEVEEGKSGFAHFFEHMMFRGTKKYPDYDAESERMGSARNAFTSDDMTVYYMVAASEYLEKVIDLESDRFMSLDYPEAEFRTEAGAVLGEYQNSAYSPFSVLDRAVRETAFEKHTYRHQTIGFEADVRAMPEGYEYSRQFHQRFYRPENAVVVVVGDFDPDNARQLIEQYYADWEPGYEAPDIPAEPEQTAPRTRDVQYEGRTLPILSINYRAPAWSATDREAIALEVLGQAAFGPNSDIYRRLVIEEQRLQALQPSFSLARDPNLVSINAMMNPGTEIDAIESELLTAVDALRTEPIDADDLDAVKRHLRYEFLMGLETAQDIAFSLIGPVINTGGIEAVNDYYATLETVTSQDLQKAAERYLIESGRTIVRLEQKGGAS